MNTNHYALVVGIDHYPNYRSLEGARQDAKEFADWLSNSDTGGALPAKNLKLVLSEKDPVRPVHEDIDDALEDILEATDNEPAKRLYIYFSGHGLARSNLGVDLCLAKWSKRRMGRALDSKDYLQLALESGRFEEVVMLLDCCRIRKIRKRALHSTLDFARPGDGAAHASAFIGYATQFLNAAHEAATDEPAATEPGDETEEPVVRGHFTRALIDALNGKAADPPGGVTASRLKEYLDLRTPEIAKAAGHIQKPEVVNGLASEPEPVFGSAAPVPSDDVPVRINFSADHGHIVLEDGDLSEKKSGPATSGPWLVPLKRGNYLLRVVGGDKEKSIRVTGDETGGIDVNF